MTTFSVVNAQNTFNAIVLDADTRETLIGVNVLFENLDKGGVTDLEGKVIIEDLCCHTLGRTSTQRDLDCIVDPTSNNAIKYS